ncbi:MAG: hypothetical protein HKN84_07095 [Gammaproteobacteria bacterium]|nr:hypothetical protein [Gammaproteobacteria bacterium]
MRISKIPLPDDAKEELLAKEYLITVPFAVLGMVLLVVARWIEMHKFVLLWWAAALLATFAFFLVSGRSRRVIVSILAGFAAVSLATEFMGYREIASFLVAGGSLTTMLYANYLGRRDFVQSFQNRQSAVEEANGS